MGLVTDPAARGDVAYGELYRDLHAPVLRFAYLLCGDRDLARDITADAFAKTLVPWRAGAIRDPGAYVRRAVANALRDRYRRATTAAAHASRVASAGAVDEEPVAEREVVRAALGELGGRQRAVVILRFYEGRSEAEIAEILGIRVGTVKSQLHRGLGRLRAVLDPFGLDEVER